VIQALRKRGRRVKLFDTGAFPEDGLATIEDSTLRPGRAALQVPHNVYLRGLAFHPLMGGSDTQLAERPRGWIAQCDEKRAMLDSFILLLARSGARLINTLEVNALHSQKPLQIALLHRAGLPVPRTLSSNDPVQVRRFVRTVKRVVYKPLAGGATVQEMTSADLSGERLATLTLAPVLFQEYIEGTAVRAYVVGRKLLGAAKIEADTLDYRTDTAATLAPVTLTKAERAAMLQSAKVSGMLFAGIDFIRTADSFRVLDVNPSPMFAVFEKRTGIDVAGPLADFMCSR
jgi:glutathione synthase/RimK-type ligase-like ATP-grasp enzyme